MKPKPRAKATKPSPQDDEMSRAAAMMGRKGGLVKGKKGFAVTGKAAEASKKGLAARWGKAPRKGDA